MATVVRAFDWAKTPLGPLEAWPQSLKSAAAICLRSPFQMAIYWGAELNCIYNDAERKVLGRMHPGALGLPARELLRDSWPIVGPQLRGVIEHGKGIFLEDQPLSFDRSGRLEVSYFTYSYSPILDDDDEVAGVLLVTEDTTKRVLASRRSEAVREMTARSLDAPTPARACLLSADALTSGEDVPFALIYLVDEVGSLARCVAARARPGSIEATRSAVGLDAASDEVASLFRALTAGTERGMLAPARLFVTAGQRWRTPERAFVARIAGGVADPVDGYLIAGVRPDLAFDEDYENFLELAAVAIGRSVAAARARETQRRRVSDVAAIDRAKTALFSNASHELRTPLTLILGNLEELLDEAQLPSRSREKIQVAHRSALRMLKLVGALLDFSRLEAGESIGTLQDTDVAQLTAEIAAMFRSTVERAGLRLIVDCPPLPAPVRVDPEAWERIVSNLISNALKFTPKGVIHVRTRPEDGQLCLTVEDTGIGIGPEDLDDIFSRFYRSPDPRARAHEGAGIGLALVRQLARVHAGSIEARSRLGEGTRMTVRVPLAHRKTPIGSAEEQPALSPGARSSASLFVAEAKGWLAGAASRPDIKRRPTRYGVEPGPSERADTSHRPRVLVAEDNPDMREYLRRLLAPHFSVTLAPDGGTARELALRRPPSLVISDVMMPGLDGFGLIRELRRDGRTRDVPVILLSARADPDSTLHALALGADDYIIKPFGAPELLARARATLQNTRARIDAAAARGQIRERERHEGELRTLLTDLRAAQRRVAAAGDAERRRVERDLHDGAQQRLMAIRLELGLVQELLDDDPRAARRRLDDLHDELDAAVEQLRELAHGLYPPLLASDGLYAALLSVARHSVIPLTVEGEGVTRAPRSIESAAYFCCLEALQNATKHAGPGANVSIHLSMADEALQFRVCDDGAGFEPEAVRPGSGLINLRDRIDALGGRVEVTSAPGRGTTVEGRIPLL
jgi:signal transduction histidine kinase